MNRGLRGLAAVELLRYKAMSLMAQRGLNGLRAIVIVTPTRTGSVLDAGSRSSIKPPTGLNWMLALEMFQKGKSGLRISSAS